MQVVLNILAKQIIEIAHLGHSGSASVYLPHTLNHVKDYNFILNFKLSQYIWIIVILKN